MRILKYSTLIIALLSILPMYNCINLENPKTVSIQENENGYFLMRYREPFFIKGASGGAFSKELASSGGNTVRIYDTLNLKAKLDELDSLGLAAIVDIYLPKYKEIEDSFYQNPRDVKNFEVQLKRFINQFKDHPALLVWMLGNEIYYPNFISNNFADTYNGFLDIIHEMDPNHPVSTTVSSSGLNKIFSMLIKSPGIDFISVNNFGSLHDFELDKNLLFFWKKPYLISEWGFHGPWETNETNWSAPIEMSSTEKASVYKDNYKDYIASISDGRILGSLIFYWGQKQERTHTWFSNFNRNGKKTQAIYEMGNIWRNSSIPFGGPIIESLTLNQKIANKNIVLSASEMARADLKILNSQNIINGKTHWEIKPENWAIVPNQIETEPESIFSLVLTKKIEELVFKVPNKTGPYRLFVEIEDNSGFVATSNIPFYVINEKDEKGLLQN